MGSIDLIRNNVHLKGKVEVVSQISLAAEDALNIVNTESMIWNVNRKIKEWGHESDTELLYTGCVFRRLAYRQGLSRLFT